jgi:hypothetical protein
MIVYLSTIHHRHGVDRGIFATIEGAKADLAEYCRMWWYEACRINPDLPEEPSGDDDAIIQRYFSAMSNGFEESDCERFEIESFDVND